MSKVSIAGDVNGTGVFTIAAPNGNTNRTITLPDEAGTLLSTATPGVPIGGPAFSAYQSAAQTITSSTGTKVRFQTKEFDTNACFDATTNYRFTPTVAGYYQVTSSMFFNLGVTALSTSIQIFKNSSTVKSVNTGTTSANGWFTPNITALIYMNGSTDFLEVYIIQYSGAAQNLTASANTTYFQAALVRSAT